MDEFTDLSQSIENKWRVIAQVSDHALTHWWLLKSHRPVEKYVSAWLKTTGGNLGPEVREWSARALHKPRGPFSAKHKYILLPYWSVSSTSKLRHPISKIRKKYPLWFSSKNYLPKNSNIGKKILLKLPPNAYPRFQLLLFSRFLGFASWYLIFMLSGECFFKLRGQNLWYFEWLLNGNFSGLQLLQCEFPQFSW